MCFDYIIGSAYTARAETSIQYAHASLRPVAKYVSRPALESKIRDQLSSGTGLDCDDSQTVVVWGLGGSGKSQLILNYIKKHRQDYGAVIWVEAGEKETIERDFIRLHRALFPEIAGSGSNASVTVDVAVLGIKNWFHQLKRRALLVVDSADCIDNEEDPSYIDLSYFLPDAPKADIVITTRSSKAQALSSLEAVEVGQLAESEAIELFNFYAKLHVEDIEIKEEIIKIVQELGHLALAITLAGSYVATTPRIASDIGLYLPEYHIHRKRLLSRKATPNLHSYKQSVLSTWEASFEAIKRQSQVAANLLCLLAFLNFDDIFMDLFQINPNDEETDESEDPCESEEVNRSGDISGFDNMSVSQDIFIFKKSNINVNRSNSEKTPAIKITTDSQEVSTSEKISETSSEEGSFALWETLLSPQVGLDQYAVQEGFEMLQNYSLISWREDQGAYTMHKLVHTWGYDRLDSKERQKWSLASLQLLGNTIDYREELPVIKKMRFVPHLVANFTLIAQNQVTLYKFNEVHIMSILYIVVFMKKAGKWEFALRLIKYIAPFAEEVLGAEDSVTLDVKSQLAEALENEKKYKEAEALYRQVLRVQERTVDTDPKMLFQSKSGLAWILMKLDRSDEAKDLATQNLQEIKNLFQDEHSVTIKGKLDLASILAYLEQSESAEKLFSEILEVGRESTINDEYHHMCKVNFAVFLLGEDRLDEAEKLLREVLDEQEKLYGEDHPETLKSKNTLAEIMYRAGQLKEAEEFFMHILEVGERVNGTRHPSTLTTMYDLAFACRDQKKYQKAVDFAETCWRSRKDLFGAEHEDTVKAAELLESCQIGLRKSTGNFKLSSVKKLMKSLRRRK